MPSGRPKGSKNKRAMLLSGRLSDLEENLFRIAKREINCGDVKREFAAFAILAPYIFPKRSLENQGNNAPVVIQMLPRDENL